MPRLVHKMHEPCCSAHGVDMTCAQYRRTHFVEVRPCCATDAQVLAMHAAWGEADHEIRSTDA